MKTKKPIDGRDYTSRNYNLRLLGFSSYRDYLASDLWRSIRENVFAAKGKNCYLCGKPATELHHNRYHKNDLTGRRLRYIHPICRDCHKGIEFRDGDKATLVQAKTTFNRRRKRQLAAHPGRLVRPDLEPIRGSHGSETREKQPAARTAPCTTGPQRC